MFGDLLDANGIRQSLSRPGQCWDNAVAESFFATLKTELVHMHAWPTRAQARNAIFEFMEVFYNRLRLHSALGYLSPETTNGGAQDSTPGPKQRHSECVCQTGSTPGQDLEVSGILRLYDPPPSDPRRFPIGRIDRPVVEIRPGSGGGATGLLAKVRNRIDRAIKQALPEPHSALLSAILLGIRGDIPRPLINDMNAAGLTHLIAISGYNVTLLAMVIRRLAGVLFGRRAVFVVMAVLPMYAALVGADPPVVRATILAELVLFAWIVGRESHLLTTLMLSAAAMTLADPDILGQVSFQLSFVATLGLVTLAPRISAALGFMPRLLAEVIAVAVAAQILVSPLLAIHFGRLSLLAVPANVMATPISPWVMSTGALTSIWSLVGLPGRELAGVDGLDAAGIPDLAVTLLGKHTPVADADTANPGMGRRYVLCRDRRIDLVRLPTRRSRIS